jgi:hypothetical protein
MKASTVSTTGAPSKLVGWATYPVSLAIQSNDGMVRDQLSGGHLQATEDQFKAKTSFYKCLVGTIMQAHLVQKQEANAAISLPACSIPWNKRTDGNRMGTKMVTLLLSLLYMGQYFHSVH